LQGKWYQARGILALGFPNLLRARVVKANGAGCACSEKWKREELQRTPFAILDEPPSELGPKKGRK
jgi:hypothetical protein